MKNCLGIFLCVVVLLAVTFGAFFWFPTSINYHITERYKFVSGEEAATVFLGILVPRSGPYQDVRNIQVNWQGDQQIERKTCVDVVKLSSSIEAGDIREAIIEYDLRVSHGFVFWKEPVDECHLMAHHMIESDHPAIVYGAARITSGNSWWDVYELYEFTSDYLTWAGESPECEVGASALEAYRLGMGQCGEYARLMVAFCRATGIPSRPISGLVLPRFNLFEQVQTRAWEHPGRAHAWVEFASGGFWSIADPAWGRGIWRVFHFAPLTSRSPSKRRGQGSPPTDLVGSRPCTGVGEVTTT